MNEIWREIKIYWLVVLMHLNPSPPPLVNASWRCPCMEQHHIIGQHVNFDIDSSCLLIIKYSWWSSPEMLSMPRAGVLCTSHRRRHKKPFIMVALWLCTPSPPVVSIFSQSLMILGRRIWPADMWNLFWGGFLQLVPRAPQKSAKECIRLKNLCTRKIRRK